MGLLNTLLVIVLLICVSAFFSISEISLAASRKLKLKVMEEEGHPNAAKVLALQEHPGHFFTVVQIGLNAVAILGGILGESAFSPGFAHVIGWFYQGENLTTISFLLSFFTLTSLFILFADLMPKRLGMVAPEKVAVAVVGPMLFCVVVLKPLVWLFNGLCNSLFKVFKLPTARKDEITTGDIVAMMDAGAQTGALQQQEHHLIENVFELESRTVPSSMTQRENVAFFKLQDNETSIKNTIAENPHTKFLVCDGAIDKVIGYVDSKDILIRVVNGQPISLKTDALIRNVLIIPDSLTLFEVLERFKASGEDFAVILNEYALVVGIITLNDVMSTVMGNLITQYQEEQIVKRDEHTWLVDGVTPLEDVMRALDIEGFPDDENYETIAGFMMYTLRKIPKRTDCVEYAGYKFEVVDIDSYKIDQLLVTKLPSPAE